MQKTLSDVINLALMIKGLHISLISPFLWVVKLPKLLILRAHLRYLYF